MTDAIQPKHEAYSPYASLDETEKNIREMLTQLQQSYNQQAKPLIDALVEIQNRRPLVYEIDGHTFHRLKPERIKEENNGN